MQPASATDAEAELAGLREEFPRFRIWREVSGDRLRYIARSLDLGASPYTVVTASLAELCEILGGAATQAQLVPARPFDTAAPNIARIYDRWLGGKDNFGADRQPADAVTAQFPEISQVARANRQFVRRALGAGGPPGPGAAEVRVFRFPPGRVTEVHPDRRGMERLAAPHPLGDSPDRRVRGRRRRVGCCAEHPFTLTRSSHEGLARR